MVLDLKFPKIADLTYKYMCSIYYYIIVCNVIYYIIGILVDMVTILWG